VNQFSVLKRTSFSCH